MLVNIIFTTPAAAPPNQCSSKVRRPRSKTCDPGPPPSCIQHPSPYPLPSAFLTLGGEQILFTNSFAEFTMLFCVQVTSEVLGEVLVVEQDGTDRVRRVQVHANVHGA